MPDNKFFCLLVLICLISTPVLAQDDIAFSSAEEKIRFAHEHRVNGLSFWNMELTTLPPEFGELAHTWHLDLNANQ